MIRALIAEDDQSVQDIVTKVLGSAGYGVAPASTVEDAVATQPVRLVDLEI